MSEHDCINSFLFPLLLPPLLLCFPLLELLGTHGQKTLPGGGGLGGFLEVAKGYDPSYYQWGRGDGDRTCPVNIPGVSSYSKLLGLLLYFSFPVHATLCKMYYLEKTHFVKWKQIRFTVATNNSNETCFSKSRRNLSWSSLTFSNIKATTSHEWYFSLELWDARKWNRFISCYSVEKCSFLLRESSISSSENQKKK